MSFDIVVGSDGVLLDSFRTVGRTFVISPYITKKSNILVRIFKRVSPVFFKSVSTNRFLVKRRLKAFCLARYDLVISNTIATGDILSALPFRDAKIVTYVHEMENAIRTFTSPRGLAYVLKLSAHFLTVSKAVSNNLIINHNVSPTNISLLPSYIPLHESKSSILHSIKAELAITSQFTVGFVGTSDWRKGVDLFIQVVFALKDRIPSSCIKFIWIGADLGQQEFLRLSYDIENGGLKEYITFVSPVPNALDYMACMDVFLMTSREDPYPLVMVEAAMLSKPIICFDNSGGATEFLDNNVGIIVPYLNTMAMAEAIFDLFHSQNAIARYGFLGREKYLQSHSEQVAIPELERQIKRFCESA